MSAASTPHIAGSPLSTDGLFAYARTICGVSVGSECLPPDIEREACELFRRLASRLEAKTRKPAYAAEIAAEYHQARGNFTLITGGRQ